MTYLFISLKIQEKTECEYFEFEWIMKDHLALLGLCLLEKKMFCLVRNSGKTNRSGNTVGQNF
jgi:hypothetical protein